MAWFYRGGTRNLIAHWFDPAATASLCLRLKPDVKGVAWRHPLHDQHIPQCRHCNDKLAQRKLKKLAGVGDKGGGIDP